MDNDSLSFDYTEIKLNAGWEGRGGGDMESFGLVSCPHLPSLWGQEYIRYLYLYFKMPKIQAENVLSPKTE